MATQKRRTVRDLEIPIFCANLTPDVGNLNYAAVTMYNRGTTEPWNDTTNPFPCHPTVINDQVYRTSSSLHSLDDLKKDVQELKTREAWPRITDSTRVIVLTYDASCQDALSDLQKTISDIPRFGDLGNGAGTKNGGLQMMKRALNIPVKIFWASMLCITCIFIAESEEEDDPALKSPDSSSRTASSTFIPPPKLRGPLGEYPWLLVGLLSRTLPTLVTPKDVERFLGEQYGCIGAVECHVDDEVEVGAAFRIAVEEVDRPRVSEREMRERMRDEKRWVGKAEERMVAQKEKRGDGWRRLG